ncbi:MAG: PASTA domain-containing protein, partial [Acidimicrobiales bacterium]
RWPRRLAIIVALALLAIAGAAGGLVASGALVPSHPVPSLIGDTEAAAAGALRPLHLRLAVAGRSYSSKFRTGTVISQQPDRGRLDEGKTVSVTVSLGPQPVPVPSLANLTVDEARSVLASLGLTLGKATPATSMTVSAGEVISSSPDHGSIVPGHSVAIVVSSGKPAVAVPALSQAQSTSFDAAKAALAARQLAAVEVDEFSDTVQKGQVISTDPAGGTAVTVGSQVTVNVSKGPDLVAVPDVRDDTVSQASQVLSNDGFQVSGVTGNPTANVTGTSPGAGTMLRRGSAVQILTS